jgi:hypothetical protein
MRARSIVATAVALLAAPTTASAQSISLPGQCFYEGQKVQVSGTGFSPASNFEYIDLRGRLGTWIPAPVDANGNLFGEGEAPDIQSRLVKDEVAYWSSNPAVAFPFKVMRLDLRASPPLRPRRRSKLSLAGLPSGQPVYAHYRRGGRKVADVRWGVAQAPCGTLTTRRRGIPGRNPRRGRWLLQLDASPRYDPLTEPRIVERFRVRRR